MPGNKKRLLWILLALVVALELSIRLLERFLAVALVGSLQNFVVEESDFFYVRPGTKIVQPERYGNTLYSINGLGFRGDDTKVGSSSRKILFLGDSITFGLYVGYGSTYPALIEKMYEKKFPDRPPIEAINLAMFAYAPRHELEALNKIGWQLGPDLIVLQLYMNDFDPRTKPPSSTTRLIRDRLFVLKEHILTRSALLRRVRQAAQMLAYKLIHDLRRTYFLSTINDEEPREEAELFGRFPDEEITGFDAVEQIHLEAEKANVPLFVMLSPHEVQLFNENFDIVNRRVRDFCLRKGITFIDPLSAMRACGEKRFLFVDGSHFSVTGHKFIADWLFPQLFPGKTGSVDHGMGLSSVRRASTTRTFVPEVPKNQGEQHPAGSGNSYGVSRESEHHRKPPASTSAR
jgi:lysophospholipase L1-like esterase